MASSKPTPPSPDSFLPGDRATAPMGLEEDSASAWARFEDLQKAHEAGFDATQPAPKGGFAPTEQIGLQPAGGSRPQPAAPRRTVSIDELMLLARRNNRACPLPDAWAEFHQMLSARAAAAGHTQPVPRPVDSGAWAAASDMQKRLRLRDQIEWAQRAGLLYEAGDFLVSLSEKQWHHFGE